MAKLALTVAGGILGAVLIPGVGASLGFAIGSALGGIIGMLAFPGKGTHQYGPRVNDLQVSSSAPGVVIPLLYGTMRLGGNIIWSTGLQESTTTTSQSAKGGPSVSQTTYTYTVSFASGFCQGVSTITRIWGDSKLIFDRSGNSNPSRGVYDNTQNYAVNDLVNFSTSGDYSSASVDNFTYICMVANGPSVDFIAPPDNGSFWAQDLAATNINISKYTPPVMYTGDETQLPDPLIVSFQGAQFTPAYRGLCYAVWEDLPLADFGNRMPNMRAECTTLNTAALPMTRIPWNAPSNPVFNLVNDPTGQTTFAWDGAASGNHFIERIDLSSNTVVASGTVDIGINGLMVVDGAGYLWGVAASDTGNNILRKVDPWTFQTLVTINIRPIIGLTTSSLTAYVDAQGLPWVVGFGFNNDALSNSLGYAMFMVDATAGAVVGCFYDQPTGLAHPSQNGPGFTPALAGGDTFINLDFEQVLPVIDPTTGNCYFIYNYTREPSDVFSGWIIKQISLKPQSVAPVAGPPVSPFPVFTTTTTYFYSPDASVGVGHAMFWNAADSTLLVLTNGGAFLKIDPTTGAVLETVGSNSNQQFGVTVTGNYITQKIGLSWLTVDGGAAGGGLQAAFQGQVKNGLIWAPSKAADNFGENVLVFAVNTLLQISEYDLGAYPNKPAGSGSAWVESGAGPGSFLYDSVANGIIAVSGLPAGGGFTTTYAIYRGFLDRLSVTGGITADVIVNAICQMATIPAENIDVSQLSSIPVLGYPISSLSAGKDIINTLGQTYFFEGRESDFKLQFITRGQPVSMDIPADDLGLVADNAALVESIQQEQEVPKDVEVMYIDQNVDYQQGQQKRIRHSRTKKTLNQTSISLPIVMNAQQAAQLADKLLWTAETERNTYKTNLWKALYMLLDPCDVITFTYNGVLFTARINGNTIGQNYAIALELVREDSNTYVSVVNGSNNTGFQGQTIGVLAKTLLWLLDIPYLQDTDADAAGNTGYYFAVAPGTTSSAWAAGVLYGSSDNSAWNQVDASSRAVSYAIAQNILGLPPVGVFAWDYVNTLTVRMSGQSVPPSSDTALNVLNGTNAVIMYPSLEIIQFQTATVNADGSITLSKLLRGRRGTDDFVGSHTLGETVFFPLANAGVIHEQVSLSLLNLLRYYKGITVGADLNSNLASQQFSIKGRDLMPYAPSGFANNPSGSDILFTWFRRTRLGGALQDGTGQVPLAESAELYSIDILNGAGAVVRTFNNIAPPGGILDSWTSPAQPHQLYTSAQKTADGYTPGAGWSAVCYQLSGQVGRGFATPVVLP